MSTPPQSWYQPLSQLAPRQIDWLWSGRLAAGKLAILDGDPGLGKSLIALDLCARLSTGRPFPGDLTGPPPAAALVLNSEDAAADTLRPRLQALGADLDRVFIPRGDDVSHHGPLHFPDDATLLDQAVAALTARLVVIDPVTAFFDSAVLWTSDPSVRRALRPLAEVAERHACAMLFVRHLNKYASHRALYRGGGSIGIVGACRSAWLAAPEPHSPDRCLLAQVKNNLGPPQPSFAYSFQSAPGAAVSLSWLGSSPWTADQLLTEAARRPRSCPDRARARAFLEQALAAGPLSTRELWDRARGQAIKPRTLRRARLDVHVRSSYVFLEGRRQTFWLLPGQQLPNSAPPEDAAADLEAWLAPLREQFPPPTPLDRPDP